MGLRRDPAPLTGTSNLVAAGMTLTPADLERFVCDLAADGEMWEPYVKHCPEARAYEQIWDDNEVNAWVICWSKDHDTGFHDHDESAAAIVVVSGHVREDRLRLGGPPASRVIAPGAPFFVPPSAIHRVLHAGSGPAVTIHAYSPPLRRTGAYLVGAAGELERISQSYEEELQAKLPIGRPRVACTNARPHIQDRPLV